MEISKEISDKFKESLRLFEKNLDELNRKEDHLNSFILESSKNILHVEQIYDKMFEISENLKKTESELMEKIELRVLNKLLTTLAEKIDNELDAQKVISLLSIYSELSENDMETTKKILKITDG